MTAELQIPEGSFLAPNQVQGGLVAGPREVQFPGVDHSPDDDRSGYTVTPVMGDVAILKPATLSPQEMVGRDEAIRIWLNAYSSAHTREAYGRDIRAWFDWLDLYGVSLETARRGDVDAYRAEMEDAELPPAPATVRRRLAVVSSFSRYWVEDDVLDRNPAAHARRPKASTEPGSIALTKEQAHQLVAYIDQLPDARPTLVVRLLLETGMRVSELCSAAVTDLSVSSGHRTLTIVRKGGTVATTVLLPGKAKRPRSEDRGRSLLVGPWRSRA